MSRGKENLKSHSLFNNFHSLPLQVFRSLLRISFNFSWAISKWGERLTEGQESCQQNMTFPNQTLFMHVHQSGTHGTRSGSRFSGRDPVPFSSPFSSLYSSLFLQEVNHKIQFSPLSQCTPAIALLVFHNWRVVQNHNYNMCGLRFRYKGYVFSVIYKLVLDAQSILILCEERTVLFIQSSFIHFLKSKFFRGLS